MQKGETRRRKEKGGKKKNVLKLMKVNRLQVVEGYLYIHQGKKMGTK
jgi:hypothetical protein